MNKIAHTLWERQWCLRFSQMAEVPSIPESFQVGASGCSTACRGAGGASKGCSYLRAQSLFSALRLNRISSEGNCLYRGSHQGRVWIHHQPVPSLQDKLSGTCCRRKSKTVSIDMMEWVCRNTRSKRCTNANKRRY